MIVNLLSGIIRNARNRRAAEKAQTQALNTINAQQSQLDNMFNSEYYGDYMNRSDVQSMLRSMQGQMRQQNAQSYSMAAMTGATPEAMAAQLSNNAALMGNTYSQIGANMSNWKNNVLNNYINNSMALSNQKYNLWNQQASDFRNAAHQSMTQALDNYTQIYSSLIGGAGNVLSNIL